MVTITNVLERKTEKGSFVLLELSGDLEMVQPQRTGRHYATIRKCTISSTFDLDTARSFIGKQIPGTIVRVESEPYEYTDKQSGEVLLLKHRWDYVPEEVVPSMPESVRSGLVAV